MPSPEGKDIYLTFDDGPVTGPTEFVLETLRQFSVRATFFCIGDNVRKYPRIFERVVAGGHGVGNHTQHHVSGWKYSVDRYVEEVQACEEEFVRSGLAPVGRQKLFRPPYGRITHAQVRALQDYSFVMWDVLTQDYRRNLSPEKCLKNSLKVVRPGSIVVFHDSIKASPNLLFVLPRFIKSCLERGYRFTIFDL